MRPTTKTTPKRLLVPLILILTLLSSTTTTTDARAIPQKRTPDSNDGNSDTLIVYPPSGHNPDHILYPPGKDPGSLHTDNKRRKRSDTQLRVEAEAEEGSGAKIEKRNLFSQVLNSGRLHRRPSTHHLYNLHTNDVANIDTKGSGNGRAEEYPYWSAEEEDEEEIDEEVDLERHVGIYEDDDDDNLGSEDVGIVRQVIGGDSTPIIIEPFIRHPAHGSSLFDTDISSSSNGNDLASDLDEKNSNAGDNNNNDEDDEEDLERIQASQPWLQHQYSSSSSPKHHHNNKNNDDADILKSQIWIVDEWDEDFDGVEETIDDFIDWIDDLDHVRARLAGDGHSGINFPLRRLFS
ncbi:hypothetical protein BKA57DRAFT_464129 [Linnemannia elongata]|nr:hypothetical protein BKA57DRAFT_464129 [Linnemannia elongata]